jgi:hypothetical protein
MHAGIRFGQVTGFAMRVYFAVKKSEKFFSEGSFK